MMNSVKTLGFIIIFYIGFASCKNTPIVFWHGMGDSCCNVYVQQFIDNTILKHIPGVYYFPIRIGGNTIDEMVNSYLGDTNKLIQLVCEMIQNDANLTNGYYAIGFSQGSQFLRAVGQRCSNPPMLKLITLAGQHQGVYGIPKCRTGLFCNIGAYAVSLLAYFSFTQRNFVQATYWHDPFNEEIYRKHNNFLADINQEQGFNPLYKKNMQRLKAFVMVKFVRDQMVNPHETSWFGFFKKGSFSEVYTMEESELYINDTLGLKTLDQQGKIFRLAIDGDHLEMSQAWFIKEIVLPFLKD